VGKKATQTYSDWILVRRSSPQHPRMPSEELKYRDAQWFCTFLLMQECAREHDGNLYICDVLSLKDTNVLTLELRGPTLLP
jgi:hypothetical protein